MSAEHPKCVDPGHAHLIQTLTPEEWAEKQKDHRFNINEHLAALPEKVRGDYVRAIKGLARSGSSNT
jgi:hypothetical protein